MPEWMNSLAFWLAIVVGIALVVAAAPHLSPAAGSSERWGHDPETSQWFRGLRSSRGFPCCDYADGTRIEDPDYRENEDGSYDVQARGQVIHIPPEKIVQGTNRVGYAILWWGTSAPEPYCFLPGARG